MGTENKLKKTVVNRFIEGEDFFAEFETSLTPGEEGEEEGRGREGTRVGRGGGLEGRPGEITNMDNLSN